MDVDGIVLMPPPDDHLSGMIWRGKEEKNDGSTDAMMSVEARLQASGPILRTKIDNTFPLCSEVTAVGSIGRTGTDGSTPIGLNFAGTLACKACTSVQV